MIKYSVLGLAGVALLAVVGCGAEQGKSEGIGSANAELNANGYVTDFTGVAREFAASCIVKDTRMVGGVSVTRNFMLVAGGYNSSGLGVGDAYLYDGTSDTWATVSSLPVGQERGEAKLIKLNDSSCLMVGGLSQKSAGSVLTTAYKFTANGTTGSWTSAGSLNAGRVEFAASTCGSPASKVIVFGGHGASGFASPIALANDVEVWDGSTTWTAKGGTNGLLNAPISAFAFSAKNPQSFVLAGGRTAAGFETLVQPFTVDSTCSTITKLATAQLRNATTPASALGRWGSVSLLKSSNDHLFVMGGRDAGGNIQTDIQEFSIDFGGLGATYVTHYTAAGESLLNGVRFPTTVTDAADKLVLLGGEDNSSTTPLAATPVNYIQQVSVSGATPVVTASSPNATLSENRLGHVAEYISDDAKFYVSTGRNTQGSPGTVSLKTERLTP